MGSLFSRASGGSPAAETVSEIVTEVEALPSSALTPGTPRASLYCCSKVQPICRSLGRCCHYMHTASRPSAPPCQISPQLSSGKPSCHTALQADAYQPSTAFHTSSYDNAECCSTRDPFLKVAFLDSLLLDQRSDLNPK